MSAGSRYYVVVRDGARAHKQRVGRNRKEAERALRKIAVSVDDGDYRPQLNIAFSDWADQWINSLERKATTVHSYRSSMQFAKDVFGKKPVRRLGPEDVTRFTEFLRARPRSSPSTRARHIRVLGACLQAAYRHRYAATAGFKIIDTPAVELPVGDAAQLGLHLAVFGSDEEMPRSRLLAERIATAVSLAGRDVTAILHLTESQKDDVAIALDAMIDDRAGNLSDSLLALRQACR